MKRLTGLLFATLLAVGCSSTSMTSLENTAGSPELSKKEPTHYRLLSDPRSIREIDWGRPLTSLHVKGYLTNQGFVPLSKVEGSGGLCKDGNDFVTLADGEFHSAGSGDTPKGPYVKGCKSRTGGFMPSSKEIVVN